MLAQYDATGPFELPGEALNNGAPGTGALRRSEQIARSLAPHPVIARREVLELCHVVGEIGQLVHHDVGFERSDRGGQSFGVIDIADDRLGAERLERLDLARRAGHPGYDVAGSEQQRHEPGSDHATGAGKEDAHDHTPPATALAPRENASARQSVSMYSRTAWILPS